MNIQMRFGFAGWLRQTWDMLTTSRYEKHLLAELQRVLAERDEWKAKCSKLELAIFPLASREGAAYTHLAAPPKPLEFVGGVGAKSLRSWAEIQAEHLKSLEESDEHGVRTEAAGREAEGKASGTSH